MPFENVRQLEQSGIRGIEDLSEEEKRIFLKEFNRLAYQGGTDEGEAIAQAFDLAQERGPRAERDTLTT